jgi:hypothetical protein
MLTEISGISALLVKYLGLENCPKTAIYHYYFIEASLPDKKIYKSGPGRKPTLICVIPSKTLMLLYGSDENQAIKALNDYSALGNRMDNFYVISCLDLSSHLNKLLFPTESRGFTETFTADEIGPDKIKPVPGFFLETDEKPDKIKFVVTIHGKKAGKCETLWMSSEYAEIGGGTEDKFLCRGLFTWVTGTLAKRLLEKGLKPLYIFEQGNIPSKKVAHKLFHDSGGREFTFYIKPKNEPYLA